MLSTMLTQARLTLRDTVATYRWSDANLIAFANEGIREAIAKRPDLNLDSYGNIFTFSDIPATGNYSYLKSGTPATADLSSLHLITGWDKATYPVLYFYAFGTGSSRAYISAANRTTGIAAGDDTAAVFRFVHSALATVTVTTVNTSGFAGQIQVTGIPTTADTFEYTATEVEIPIGIEYNRAIMNYMIHKAFEMDSEDTGNAQRSQYHYNRFLSQIYGG